VSGDFEPASGVAPRRARRRGHDLGGAAPVPFSLDVGGGREINEDAKRDFGGNLSGQFLSVTRTSPAHPAVGPFSPATEARLDYIALLDVDNECRCSQRCPGDLSDPCGCFAESLEQRVFLYRHRKKLEADPEFALASLHRLPAEPAKFLEARHKGHTLASKDSKTCTPTQLTA
jgi:hypothetical protein